MSNWITDPWPDDTSILAQTFLQVQDPWGPKTTTHTVSVLHVARFMKGMKKNGKKLISSHNEFHQSEILWNYTGPEEVADFNSLFKQVGYLKISWYELHIMWWCRLEYKHCYTMFSLVLRTNDNMYFLKWTDICGYRAKAMRVDKGDHLSILLLWMYPGTGQQTATGAHAHSLNKYPWNTCVEFNIGLIFDIFNRLFARLNIFWIKCW